MEAGVRHLMLVGTEHFLVQHGGCELERPRQQDWETEIAVLQYVGEIVGPRDEASQTEKALTLTENPRRWSRVRLLLRADRLPWAPRVIADRTT